MMIFLFCEKEDSLASPYCFLSVDLFLTGESEVAVIVAEEFCFPPFTTTDHPSPVACSLAGDDAVAESDVVFVDGSADFVVVGDVSDVVVVDVDDVDEVEDASLVVANVVVNVVDDVFDSKVVADDFDDVVVAGIVNDDDVVVPVCICCCCWSDCSG